MANPALRNFSLSGGPHDGKMVSVAPDEGDPLPPQNIQIEIDGELIITLPGGRTLDARKQAVYLYYKLYVLARRENREPICRYVYDGCHWQTVEGFKTIHRTSVIDRK